MSVRDPVASVLAEMRDNEEVRDSFASVLPGIVRISGDGTVELDTVRLGDELSRIFPPSIAGQVQESVGSYAAAAALPLDEGNVFVPWSAVEETFALVGGTPEQVRVALGIESVTAGDDISRMLHESYPGLPADIFTSRTAELLGHPPRRLAGAGLDDDYPYDRLDPDPEPPIERGGAQVPPSAPSKDDYLSIAACLVGGSWGPYYDDPVFNSGWILGFRVCIPYDCADALSRALLEWFVPGKLALGKALLTTVVEGTVAAGLQTLGSVAAFWLAVAAFATGFQMATANLYSGGRGVCIHFPWPYNPIPVWSSSR